MIIFFIKFFNPVLFNRTGTIQYFSICSYFIIFFDKYLIEVDIRLFLYYEAPEKNVPQ